MFIKRRAAVYFVISVKFVTLSDWSPLSSACAFSFVVIPCRSVLNFRIDKRDATADYCFIDNQMDMLTTVRVTARCFETIPCHDRVSPMKDRIDSDVVSLTPIRQRKPKPKDKIGRRSSASFTSFELFLHLQSRLEPM